MIVLALDPSLSSTGYAFINSNDKKILIKGKIVTKSKETTDDRIQKIITFLKFIIKDNKINVSSVILEDGYVGINIQSSLKLAELRGALIAYFKYNHYTVIHQQPKEIRKNFGLKGNAKKEEVAKRVLRYYPNIESEIGPYSDKPNKNKTSDIYDAISIGLSYVLNLKE